MIDFNEAVEKFGKPGTIINMVSELAIVMKMWTEPHGLLYVRILFPRNIGKSTDLLVFDQDEAQEFQVDKWQIVTVEDLTNELNAITGRIPQSDCEQLDTQAIGELDIDFEQLMEEIKSG